MRISYIDSNGCSQASPWASKSLSAQMQGPSNYWMMKCIPPFTCCWTWTPDWGNFRKSFLSGKWQQAPRDSYQNTNPNLGCGRAASVKPFEAADCIKWM